jgi:putative membrane protein
MRNLGLSAEFLRREITEEIIMRRLSALAAVAVVVASAAFAQQAEDGRKFLMEAIEGNFADVQFGSLAQTNAESPDVKSFGQMLIIDHGEANRNAGAAATMMNIEAPTGPNAEQTAARNKMRNMKGKEFDRAFVDHMAAEHKKTVDKYRNQAKAPDPSGQYAQNILPVVEKHLQDAIDLQKKVSSK